MQPSRKKLRRRKPRAIIREARFLIAQGAGTRVAFDFVCAHGKLGKRDRADVRDRLFAEQGE